MFHLLTMLMYNVILQVFTLLTSLSQCFSFGCSNLKLSDRARMMFYNAHNDARRSLAKGQEPHKCGKLSSGKNIYQLNWSCDMELKVQKWAENCPSTMQTIESSWGHMYSKWISSKMDPLAKSAEFVNAWWSAIRQQPLTDPDNKYTGAPFGFANMAYGKTTEFACTYNMCNTTLVTACFYNKIGYITNQVIYEKGEPCVVDSDCTTYAGSTCNDGLCYIPLKEPVIETYSMCPGVTDMSDQLRMSFLNTHNYYRSQLARGLAPDGIASGAFAAPAKHMPKLMVWDRTTDIGCFVMHCPTSTYSVCQYYKAGNYYGQPVYKFGAPCSQDSDCPDTQTCSVSEGLCIMNDNVPIVATTVPNQTQNPITMQPTTNNPAAVTTPPSDIETYTICPGVTDISDQVRMMFLNTHNYYRSQLAKGLAPDGIAPGAFAAPAKHMPKLRYNCDIEASARNYGLQCIIKHSDQSMRPLYGENLYYTTMENHDKIHSAKLASDWWWSELGDYGFGNATEFSKELLDRGIGHFTNLVWDRTTDVGCFVMHCPGKTYAVCQYYKEGNYYGQPVYEFGPACTNDDDCPGTQTCSASEGLCVVHDEITNPASPGSKTYTMCPGVTDMPDQARMSFLNAHNKYRSRLAKGLEQDGIAPGAFASPAKHMPKLRYNCDVEASARAFGLQCQLLHSPQSMRPEYGENLYYTTSVNYSKISSGELASDWWWAELKQYGLGSDNVFSDQRFNIAHFTNMAWDKTTDLGCFVAHCPTMTYSICQYYKGGNTFGQVIYEFGSACTKDADCPGTQTCNASEGLCIV
ncbi:unnamed protein product [Caenorhabditis bovis]|uniref:SCP domain-containing protein n=1 Tax=Caenorhabditis bovis TaxID=2654633 RepID=A0A8S1EGE2_9PELO|nr:unnamed protein product [Caenorhabditis bovis]